MKDYKDIKTVAIIGTGLIGFGWAHIFCRKGIVTRIYDKYPEALQTGYQKLVEQLNLFSELGLIKEKDINPALEKVILCQDLKEAVTGADYVQECVSENLELKQQLFAEIDAMTPPETIIASSTSGLRVTDMAKFTKYPERCVLAHPTNPPHIVPLVEVVAGEKTSPEVVQTTYHFMEWIGQKPIICKEVTGFVLNRLQYALLKEAFCLARAGVATPAAIDRAITEGLGLRWAFTGPYAVAELNAKDVATYLKHLGPTIKAIVADFAEFDGPNEEDIRIASEGMKEILAGQTHDELLDKRTKVILKLRSLKEKSGF